VGGGVGLGVRGGAGIAVGLAVGLVVGFGVTDGRCVRVGAVLAARVGALVADRTSPDGLALGVEAPSVDAVALGSGVGLPPTTPGLPPGDRPKGPCGQRLAKARPRMARTTRAIPVSRTNRSRGAPGGIGTIDGARRFDRGGSAA
jgi:hypothetical protein